MKYENDLEAFKALEQKYNLLRAELSKVIVGQDWVLRNALISVFSMGHVLLVGVPGLAKTLMVNSISKVLGLSYNRIQFTPDLMPSDIIGSEILDKNREFRFIKGPVFANIILADEINRTPPKTQSALLEAMQEKSITVAGKRYLLEEPFFVLATQNPIELEGTYPLPEAQLDRFMFSIWVDYPTFDEEIEIIERTTTNVSTELKVVMSSEEIIYFQKLVRKIPVTKNVYSYAVSLAGKTRRGTSSAHQWADRYLTWGAGPRASQYLIIGAKCHAALSGKLSPDIEDVNAVAHSVLRHRIVKNYKADAEEISVDDIINKLLEG